MKPIVLKPGEMIFESRDWRFKEPHSRQCVGVHALTATSTTETFYIVSRRLCIDDPTLIASPPFRDNISYGSYFNGCC